MIHFFNYWKKRISELFNTKMVYSYKDICGTSVSVCQKKKEKEKISRECVHIFLLLFKYFMKKIHYFIFSFIPWVTFTNILCLAFVCGKYSNVSVVTVISVILFFWSWKTYCSFSSRSSKSFQQSDQHSITCLAVLPLLPNSHQSRNTYH